MRLKSLKVSNILSYKLLSDFDNEADTITFKDGLNIFIGSNGSGKSNLLEVINKLFQAHFFENHFINDDVVYQSNAQEKAIKVNTDKKNSIHNTLFKNFDNRNSESLVQIGISPDSGDIENLTFLINHFDDLKKLCQKYCENDAFFSTANKIEISKLKDISTATYKFKIEQHDYRINFALLKGADSPEHKLFYDYLFYFNKLQTLLEVINLYEDKEWQLMKNPFALISSMRTYGGFNNSVSVGTGLNRQIKETHQSDANSSTKNYVSTDYIFRIAGIKIGQQFRFLRDEGGAEEALKKLNTGDTVLTRINALIKKNLGFQLKLEKYNPGNDTVLLTVYQGTNEVNFTELSMGQKSIFYLLFAIYGFDIENGLLIIDEPELHLHVTMQKKYFSILKEVCDQAKIQILIATHSSAFIDEHTIKNTFRFFKESNSTNIVNPKEIKQPEKDLLKILTYTNSSRIFFSDDVVLVEGDSDEYFFNFFYENHIKALIKNRSEEEGGQQKTFKTEKTIEILYIGGKGNFRKWREFLDLFKINSYFIGDFDNVKDHGVLGKAGVDIKELIAKSKEHVLSKFLGEKINAKETKDGKELLRQVDTLISKNFEISEGEKQELRDLWVYLTEKQGVKKSHLIDYLKSTSSNGTYDNVKTEIDTLYKDRVYILKEGDLEDYLGISKDLTNVINFCHSDFDTWSKSGSEKSRELESIFKDILEIK